jgi:hypothetical protein|tara:strand:- start:3552 stop:3995 length:444 start_codon:yes stop_codon:yes gene_type:complete
MQKGKEGNRSPKEVNFLKNVAGETIRPEKKVIVVDVKDRKMNKIDEFQLTMSRHSIERVNERDISNEALSIALIYGTAFFKQGLIFYVLGEKNMPYLNDEKLLRKCKNIVVVVAGDSDEIITTYRSKNPFKHIKKKTKRLTKYNNAA